MADNKLNMTQKLKFRSTFQKGKKYVDKGENAVWQPQHFLLFPLYYQSLYSSGLTKVSTAWYMVRWTLAGLIKDLSYKILCTPNKPLFLRVCSRPTRQ